MPTHYRFLCLTDKVAPLSFQSILFTTGLAPDLKVHLSDINVATPALCFWHGLSFINLSLSTRSIAFMGHLLTS